MSSGDVLFFLGLSLHFVCVVSLLAAATTKGNAILEYALKIVAHNQ